MEAPRKLTYEELINNYGPRKFDFETTRDLESFKGLIGQERAESAIKFGLGIKRAGYNIFIAGEEGLGKTSYAIEAARKIAETEPTPPDICYVYNFKDAKTPKALLLPAGTGKELRADLEGLLRALAGDISKIAGSRAFEMKRLFIMRNFHERRDFLIKLITEEAKKRQFGVETTNQGIFFMPLVNGEMINEEQYDALSIDEKISIERVSEEIQSTASSIMEELRKTEIEAKNEIDKFEYGEFLNPINRRFGALIQKYSGIPDAAEYLKDLKEDVLDNSDDFLDDDEPDEQLRSLAPWLPAREREDRFNKYQINVLTDNSDLTGAPVIIDYNPAYSKLVGEIEYDNEYGNLNTDYMKMRAGALHKANGGYLILQARDVLTNAASWDTLKRILKIGEIGIEPLKEYSTGLVVNYIKPQPIKLNVKIIMIGTPYFYDLLDYYDEDFKSLFKIKSDFDYETDDDAQTCLEIARFVKKIVTAENIPDFTAGAVAELLNYAKRQAGNQQKLSTKLSDVYDAAVEASEWAKADGAEVISAEYVIKAVEQKIYRNSLYEGKLNEMIDNDIVVIDTTGKRVGQINGLAVIEEDDYMFGKPTRITATAFIGEAGVINIEDEVHMSGHIHNKGVQILSGYMGQKYSQNFPASFSSKVCFEQNYSGIDGDSASSTELYAILSSLSEIPISQEIAVTGSINQFGDIQPIGGITQKVEGFYDLCVKRGLTGAQGVAIPIQNVRDLALKTEVAEAIKNNKFSLYPIKCVDEGIEILMGIPAGTPDKNGRYPDGSLHAKVLEKLKLFYEKNISSSDKDNN